MAGSSQALPDSLRLPRSEPACLSNFQSVFRATRGRFNPISSHRQRKSLADEFHDEDGHELFVTPPDFQKGLPGVTKKELARFKNWARSPKIAPATPLTDEQKITLQKDFRSRYHKRDIGDGNNILRVDAYFKQKRFVEIKRLHANTRNIKKVHDGNLSVNKYLEHHTSGGVYVKDPYSCNAFAEQEDIRDLCHAGFGQLLHRPVGRERVCRTLPRPRAFKTVEPKPDMYNYIEPSKTYELPKFWQGKCPGIDVPYAPDDGPARIFSPIPDEFDLLTVWPNAQQLAHQFQAHNNILEELASSTDDDEDAPPNAQDFLQSYPTHQVEAFLAYRHGRLFSCTKTDLFHFLMARFPIQDMARFFQLHPDTSYNELRQRLSLLDQANIMWFH